MVVLQYINKNYMKKWEHIGVFEDVGKVHTEITEFWYKLGKEIPHRREWVDDKGWTHIDIGSHTQFYKYKEFSVMDVETKSLALDDTTDAIVTILFSDGEILSFGIGSDEEDAKDNMYRRIN